MTAFPHRIVAAEDGNNRPRLEGSKVAETVFTEWLAGIISHRN